MEGGGELCFSIVCFCTVRVVGNRGHIDCRCFCSCCCSRRCWSQPVSTLSWPAFDGNLLLSRPMRPIGSVEGELCFATACSCTVGIVGNREHVCCCCCCCLCSVGNTRSLFCCCVTTSCVPAFAEAVCSGFFVLPFFAGGSPSSPAG